MASDPDPLDELGGLADMVGQTLDIFGEQLPPTGSAGGSSRNENPFAASTDPLDALGSGGARGGSVDVMGVAPSADLDLFGGPGPAAGMPRGASLPMSPPEAEIPLITEEAPAGNNPFSHSSPAPPPARFDPPAASWGVEPAAPSPAREGQDEGASTSAGGATPESGAEEATVRVWIRDPEKMDGVNKLGMRTTYYTYLVRTESHLPGLLTEGTEVRRRFSEFDALHKLIKAAYRGYIIPPLPEKSFLDAKLGHEDFLRLRRADLQAFLRSIAHHPALRESEALKLFLLQPGELQYNPAWIALLHSIGSSPDAHEGLVSSLVPGGLSGGGSTTAKAAAGLSSLMSWVRHSVLVPSKRELDEDEQQLRQAKELMKDLERLLQLSCESARIMCSHMESLAGDLYELGRNMGMLSKWEETLRAHSGTYTEAGYSASKRAADCKQLSYASAKQNSVWKAAAVKTAASLVSLHDYYILVPEAVNALEERERCLDQIHELEAELGAKNQELSKTAGGRGAINGRDRRAYTLTNSVDKLEEQLKALRDQYAVIKQRNLEELRRLHLAREQDFRAMMAGFAAVQAQLLAQSADMWRTTARSFAGEADATPRRLADDDSQAED